MTMGMEIGVVIGWVMIAVVVVVGGISICVVSSIGVVIIILALIEQWYYFSCVCSFRFAFRMLN